LSMRSAAPHSLPSVPSGVSSPSLLNAPAPTELSTLSLHDALPISRVTITVIGMAQLPRSAIPNKSLILSIIAGIVLLRFISVAADRKSTRLNSSHVKISYAVFCLKKKRNQPRAPTRHGTLPRLHPH